MMIALGIIAGICTSISFIPQALITIRTKETKNISFITYFLFTLGVLIWVIYGLLKHDTAVFLTNIVTFVPTIIILLLKVRDMLKERKLTTNK
ncbi:MAG: SemiSWEET transporter [Lactobacillales bacterium]|jgi:MtN3 and saliva related transmembrane protein|nr:SemiSWEET transporter [Lactobacillales bacterium]